MNTEVLEEDLFGCDEPSLAARDQTGHSNRRDCRQTDLYGQYCQCET